MKRVVDHVLVRCDFSHVLVRFLFLVPYLQKAFFSFQYVKCSL